MKQIQRNILKTLLACDGTPMPESALIAAVDMLCRPARVTRSDIEQGIKHLDGEKLIMGVSDELTETTWTLTDQGTHKARKL